MSPYYDVAHAPACQTNGETEISPTPNHQPTGRQPRNKTAPAPSSPVLTTARISSWCGLVLIIGSILSALFLFFAPSLSTWGQRHSAHLEAKFLPLSSGQTIAQTFLFEQTMLDGVAIWFDTASLQPDDGLITLTISTATGNYASRLPLANLSPDGIGFFQFTRPLPAPPDKRGTIRLSLADTNQRLLLKYQIDATKFADGALYYSPNPNQEGDLAWQIRYRRPPLAPKPLLITYVLLLLTSGLAAALLLKYLISIPPVVTTAPRPPGASRGQVISISQTILLPFFLTASTFLFYVLILLRPGTWIGPSDFSKELSYVTASAEAIRAFSWPIWSHYTCGGMSLLGNPEGTTLSLSTVLAFIAGRPELSLWLTLAVEASLAGLGAYYLARALGLSPPASSLALLITSFSAVFPYKIIEGIVMVGGPVAFTPWALLALHQSIKRRSPVWALTGGLALTAMFWRGDVHIIIGVLTIMLVWSAYALHRQRRFVVLIPFLLMLLIFFLGASVKILPYLEQTNLINSQVDPHSAQITQQKLWWDVFLKAHDREYKIPVQHGLPEHFGYFGAYIGIIPLGLALTSLFSRHPWRILGWLLLITSLVIADGYLYEHVLRHLGPLSSLLRMPSRLLTISVLLLSLLAGVGFDLIISLCRHVKLPAPRPAAIIFSISALLLALPAYDLSRTSYRLLNRNLSNRSYTVLPPPTVPTLVPHLNQSLADQHPSVLLRSGYLLPHLCGDQNNPPDFLSQISSATPLTDLRATLAPNRITLFDPPPNRSVFVRTRFVSSWHSTAGTLLAAPDQSIQLLTPSYPLSSIQLEYQSATARSQQILLLTIITVSLLVIYQFVYPLLSCARPAPLTDGPPRQA